MHLKTDWASLIVGSKFTVFSLFYFNVLEGKFSSTSPWGAYIWRGDLMEGFLCYWFGGLHLEERIHGGAYFRNFTVIWLLFLAYLWTNTKSSSRKSFFKK